MPSPRALSRRPIDEAGMLQCPIAAGDIDHERCGGCSWLVGFDIGEGGTAAAIVCDPKIDRLQSLLSGFPTRQLE